MRHNRFKEFLQCSREPLPGSIETRVRVIRRELQVNKHLTQGERLILEMQLINYDLLKSR